MVKSMVFGRIILFTYLGSIFHVTLDFLKVLIFLPFLDDFLPRNRTVRKLKKLCDFLLN